MTVKPPGPNITHSDVHRAQADNVNIYHGLHDLERKVSTASLKREAFQPLPFC